MEARRTKAIKAEEEEECAAEVAAAERSSDAVLDVWLGGAKEEVGANCNTIVLLLLRSSGSFLFVGDGRW